MSPYLAAGIGYSLGLLCGLLIAVLLLGLVQRRPKG